MTTYHYEDSPQLCGQLHDEGLPVTAHRVRDRRGSGSLERIQADIRTWQQAQSVVQDEDTRPPAPVAEYRPPFPDPGEVARRVGLMRAQFWTERADVDYHRLASRLAPVGPAPMPTVDHAAFGAYIGRKMRGEPTHGPTEPTDPAA